MVERRTLIYRPKPPHTIQVCNVALCAENSPNVFVANYFTLKFSGAGRSALVLEKEIGGGLVLEKEIGGLDIIFDIFVCSSDQTFSWTN